MPTPIVVDLSHHNTIPSSLIPAKEAGIIGLIHKLTEGTTYVDSKVVARWELSNEAEMLWGLYHFVRPGDPKKQAEFMFSKAGSLKVYNEQTLWVLDWEDAGVTTSDAVAFLTRLEQLTGREPILYSGHIAKEAQEKKFNSAITLYKLWLCQYTSGTPSLPAGFPAWWLWQYSDQGNIPGIQPPTDVNAYGGSPDQLIEDWTGQAVLPPEEAVVLVEVTAPPGVRVDLKIKGGARGPA